MKITSCSATVSSLALALGMAGVMPVAAETLVGLTASGSHLLRFDSAVPGTISDTVPISGLQVGETLVGIDTRPRTGVLYGLAHTVDPERLRVYRLDPVTGVVVPVGTTVYGSAIPGLRYGVDFNPTVDRLRVVNSADENLRLNPNSGLLAGDDTNLTPVGADVGAVAYDRSVDGASLTTEFGISRASASLVRIGGIDGTPSPNGGAITTVGPLNIPLDPNVDFGFEITPSGVAYLSATSAGVTRLFTVNLSSGAALPVGIIGNGGTAVSSLTTITLPEPLLALDADAKQLLHFNSNSPERIDATVSITGLQGGAGEAVLGVDFRPATGELFLLSRTNSGATDNLRSYLLNPDTGVATALGVPLPDIATSANYGMDFNPSTDRIRVVNAADDNLRINPNNAARSDFPINDTNLNPTGQSIDAVAHRLEPGASSISLFGIARAFDGIPALVRIGGIGGNPSPNLGTIGLVQGLGVTPSGLGGIGFDVAAAGWGYAVLTDSATSRSDLYRILFEPVLNSAGAVLVGRVGDGTRSLSGLAVFPPPPQIFANGFE